MTDNERKENNTCAPSAEPSTPSAYTYRWSYDEQSAFDAYASQKKKSRGIAVNAIVMTAVFLLCFAVLIGTLIWYGAEPPVGNHSGNGQQYYPVTGDVLSTGDVAELIKPSTVLIYATGKTSSSYGTGFFLTSDGYIATNYHVLENKTTYTVTLYPGDEELSAELIGYSAPDDLAVLKIKGRNYPAVQTGNSDALRVGDVAIAVGNPSGFDASWTTTQGIISALARPVTVNGTSSIEEMTMIQTDAALNPGNSGGPLCNNRGEVIGVVARKLTDTEGISFAIPINGAMEILNAIIRDGHANNVQSSITKVRPTVGITGGTIKKGDSYTYGGTTYTAGRGGVLVVTVDEKGAARNALKVCDIIIGFDGKSVTKMEDLTELLYQYKVGDKVDIIVWRDSAEVTVSVTLGKAG